MSPLDSLAGMGPGFEPCQGCADREAEIERLKRELVAAEDANESREMEIGRLTDAADTLRSRMEKAKDLLVDFYQVTEGPAGSYGDVLFHLGYDAWGRPLCAHKWVEERCQTDTLLVCSKCGLDKWAYFRDPRCYLCNDELVSDFERQKQECTACRNDRVNDGDDITMGEDDDE